LFLLCAALSLGICQDLVNDAGAALRHLEERRQELRMQLKQGKRSAYTVLDDMLAVGLWKEALSNLEAGADVTGPQRAVLRAKYWWLNNDFDKSADELERLRAADRRSPMVARMDATLLIEAWKLPEAEALCKDVLSAHPGDERLKAVLGRALLLQKKYEEALALAKDMQRMNPQSAAAYLLEGDVYFWDQRPALAEAPIIRCLELDPLEANARFSYGYAIWRRIDATQLDDMAAQWEVALAINPLHFQTHWHWGNGHTNLTFADYVDKDEKAIRAKLEAADQLVREGNIDGALAVTREVQQEYRNSVLPLMHRASIYYSDFDHPDRPARLDSAQSIFQEVLQTKRHYGPAHNGLSAVIKSKRIPYLASYDSVTNRLKNTAIRDWDNFAKVFPDVAYYPGEIAKGMVWNQLYSAVVYFPFLTKQNNAFVIPPLHIDLAIAMKSPYFRFNTTFDNRQWMDIRGVGSGAADIGYVERGAYGERNVILHEYVHLFHGRVLTDEQNRRIRALYFNAMEKGLTLDYYSQNNESEYLAQTYPAYFEHVKVHPLDFKSMNTHHDLVTKDPEMYRFLQELTAKEAAYLAGDESAMASNWAQVYLNLSNRAQRTDADLAQRYLDTALVYDSRYLPALLGYARLKLAAGDFAGAKRYVQEVVELDSGYAPAYVVQAEIAGKEQGDSEAAIREQAMFYDKAVAKETDFQIKAQNAIQLRTFYHRNGLIAEAVRAADEYVTIGAEVSTYLRDRKDDARAYAATERALLGNPEPLAELTQLVAKRPQNYNLRGNYADALIANGRYTEAVSTLLEAQRILEASSSGRPDFELRIAEAYAMQPDKGDSLNVYIGKLLANGIDTDRLDEQHNQRLVRLLSKVGKGEEAEALLQKLPRDGDRFYRSSRALSEALLAVRSGRAQEAVALFEESIRLNPHQVQAYQELKTLYSGDQVKINRLDEAMELRLNY
jgi:Putative Zn-dependent protease, contains TPR repeats